MTEGVLDFAERGGHRHNPGSVATPLDRPSLPSLPGRCSDAQVTAAIEWYLTRLTRLPPNVFRRCAACRSSVFVARRSIGVAMALIPATQALRWRSDPVGCDRPQARRPARTEQHHRGGGIRGLERRG